VFRMPYEAELDEMIEEIEKLPYKNMSKTKEKKIIKQKVAFFLNGS